VEKVISKPMLVFGTVLGFALLVAGCGGPGPASPTADPTSVPPPAPTATASPSPTLEATPLPAVEPGLLQLSSVDQLSAAFSHDQGQARLVLLLSKGCPSCILGARWVDLALLAPHPDLQISVYAIWFPTVTDDLPPPGENDRWDPDALHDSRVVSYWDPSRAVSMFLAGQLPPEGITRSTVPQTFGGLQWGQYVWDAYYLFGPDAEWTDEPTPLDLSAYPIISNRAALLSALGSEPSAQISVPGPADFEIDPDQSLASYGVRETLVGRNLNYAVGVTHQVQGTIHWDPTDPAEISLSPMTVDISSLESDNFLRDERIREQFLESATYPRAVFTPDELIGLPDNIPSGEPIDFQIAGTLEVREVRVPVTFDVQATLMGDRTEGKATAQIKMTDFGFDPPAIGDLIKAENEVDLTLEFVALESGS
jgi:polyisoprenoid-binding protein YceI